MRPEVRMLCIGFASGEVPQVPANLLLVKNVSVMGFYWGGYLPFAPDLLTDSLAELMALHAAGRIRPHVGATFPLERAEEALALLRSRASTGKVVVTI
jgi:NADPH2:quinone reductase